MLSSGMAGRVQYTARRAAPRPVARAVRPPRENKNGPEAGDTKENEGPGCGGKKKILCRSFFSRLLLFPFFV